MRKKEDIGELIARQLGAAATVSANDSLWDRIDDSLNRRRRRRYLFFLMVPATAGLIYISGAYNALFNTNSEVTVQSEITELPPNPLVENALVFDDSILAPEGYTAYPKDSTPNMRYVDPEPLNLQPVMDEMDEDSVYTKKTTYYYYNNRNQVQYNSEDPKKIDSISTLNYKQLNTKNDSIPLPNPK